MANHLSLRIYPNKDYVVNVVSDMNLASHIEYNRFYRPGCILYRRGTQIRWLFEEELLKRVR